MSDNFFLSIWTSPRRTIREIVETDPTRYVMILAMLDGVNRTIDRAVTKNLGDKVPGVAIWGAAIVFGPLGGLLSLWILSHCMRWSGSWLGGRADRTQIKAAIAWACVPTIFGLLITLAQYALVGDDLFRSDAMSEPWSQATARFFLATVACEAVLIIWTIVIISNTVAEVQGFTSAWKGLGNVLLALLLFVVPLVAFALLALSILSLLR